MALLVGQHGTGKKTYERLPILYVRGEEGNAANTRRKDHESYTKRINGPKQSRERLAALVRVPNETPGTTFISEPPDQRKTKKG